MLPEEDGQGSRYWLQGIGAERAYRVQCAGRGWGGVAREQVGAEIWPYIEAPCQPHLDCGTVGLGMKVVAVVASDCSIGIHTSHH